MKKVILLLAAVLMLLVFAGCGGDKTVPAASSDETVNEVQTPEPTPISMSDEAVGEWACVYGKHIQDSAGHTDVQAALKLNADGTGVFTVDGADHDVSWYATEYELEFFMEDGPNVGVGHSFNGQAYNGVMHLYSGYRYDPETYEYVLTKGDPADVYVPGSEGDISTQELIRGDWIGAFGFRACEGDYMALDGQDAAAIARFYVDDSGDIIPFIGINYPDARLKNVEARYDDESEQIRVSGEWDETAFQNVPVDFNNGTLRFIIPISNDIGCTYIRVNLRRPNDNGWFDEDPRMSEQNMEYCSTLTFEELAEQLGFTAEDLPPAQSPIFSGED